jgi:hypothetical protein
LKKREKKRERREEKEEESGICGLFSLCKKE